MSVVYEIPLQPKAQIVTVLLGTNEYIFRLIWCWLPIGVWILDISDYAGNPIVCGIPLVAGGDLLAQYSYLNIGGFGGGGYLFCGTDGDPLTPPVYNNLGITAHLWWQPK